MTRKNNTRRLLGVNPILKGELGAKLLKTAGSAVKNRIENDVMQLVGDVAGSGAGWVMDTLKSLRQSGGKAKRRTRGWGGSMSGGTNNISRPLSMPMAFGTTMTNVPITFGVAKRLPIRGPGLRIQGREQVAYAVTGPPFPPSTDPPIFSVDPAVTPSVASIGLNPYSSNGGQYYFPRLAIQASLFDFFVFRRFRLTYVPSTGTNTNGFLAIGYCRDGDEGIAVVDGTHAVAQLAPGFASPTYVGASLEVPCGTPGDDVYYTYQAGTSPADVRLANQGRLFGYYGGAPPATAELYGTFYVEYTIDLYSPCKSVATMPPALLALKGDSLLEVTKTASQTKVEDESKTSLSRESSIVV